MELGSGHAGEDLLLVRLLDREHQVREDDRVRARPEHASEVLDAAEHPVHLSRVDAPAFGDLGKDTGQPFKQEAAIAKLYATEAAVTATRDATQIFGGYGFVDDTLVARHYRDAKILEIGEGTSEIQRLVISRGLGLPIR